MRTGSLDERLTDGRRPQHGPERNAGRVLEVLHHPKPVSLVEPHVTGRVSFEITGHALFIGPCQHGGHQRAADAAPLVCRIDADRRQKPVRPFRIFLVQPPLLVIEIDQTLKARPTESQRESQHSGADFAREGRQAHTGGQPAAGPFHSGADVHFAVTQRIADDGSIQRGHAPAASGELFVRVDHQRIVKKCPRQHLASGGKLLLTQPHDFQSGHTHYGSCLDGKAWPLVSRVSLVDCGDISIWTGVAGLQAALGNLILRSARVPAIIPHRSRLPRSAATTKSGRSKAHVMSDHRVVSSNHRVIVVSIPKSGTYLVAEFLKALGYRWTGMHLAELAYTDYSGSALEDARRDPGRFARSEPLSISLERIHAGDFAVGHLPFKADIIDAT